MICFGPVHAPYTEEFKEYFKKHRDEFLRNPRYIYKFAIICNNFGEIINSNELKNKYKNGHLKLDEILNYLESKEFKNERPGDEKLAKYARTIGEIHTEEKFEVVQQVFDIVKERERTSIPPVYVKRNKFRGRMLSPNDILTMFAGNITDCCQKFGDEGMGAMLLGAIEENCGIFVIEEYDENGEARIIGQSLVIRQKGKDGSNDRLTFDNIEITEHVRSSLSEEEQKEILKIYQDAGKQAIDSDKKFLGELVKAGKITEDMRDSIVLKEVIAGRGYNDLELLDTLPRAETIVPDEAFYTYRTKHFGTAKPWIDSTKKGAPKGSNSYEPVVIAEMDEKDLGEIRGRNEKELRKTKLSEVELWYGKVDEVQEYTEKTIPEEQVKKIKEIEGKVYRDSQKIMNQKDVQTGYDIQDCYGLEEDIKILLGSEENWYLICGNDKEGNLHIQDLAMEGGVNSDKNEENKGVQKVSFLATAEMASSLYEIMLKAKKENRKIMCNATEDTSLINIKRMIAEGLAEIYDESGKRIISDEEKGLVYETGNEIKYRNFGNGGDIQMLDLEIRPNVEKMIEKKKRTEDFLEKVRKNKRMEGRQKEEGIDEMRRELRDDLEM